MKTYKSLSVEAFQTSCHPIGKSEVSQVISGLCHHWKTPKADCSLWAREGSCNTLAGNWVNLQLWLDMWKTHQKRLQSLKCKLNSLTGSVQLIRFLMVSKQFFPEKTTSGVCHFKTAIYCTLPSLFYMRRIMRVSQHVCGMLSSKWSRVRLLAPLQLSFRERRCLVNASDCSPGRTYCWMTN